MPPTFTTSPWTQWSNTSISSSNIYTIDTMRAMFHSNAGQNISAASYKEPFTIDGLGVKRWRLRGLIHREDGPAVEHPNGLKEWYLNGQRCRIDGPAIEWANGAFEWWYNDVLHREGGPATQHGLAQSWYQLGRRHRLDGPAVNDGHGVEQWYIKGRKIDVSTQDQFRRLMFAMEYL